MTDNNPSYRHGRDNAPAVDSYYSYNQGWREQPASRGLFGSGTERTIGALALMFVVAVFGFVIKDALVAVNKDKTGVKTILAKRWNDRTLVFPIDGVDNAGRAATFDVVVLTKNYGWVRGSTEELERGDQRLSAEDIENEVLAPQMREGLSSAKSLIAVGLASQEGEIEREIQRGGQRAARIATWVSSFVDNTLPVWTLNLGRYLEPCAECETEDTSWQRPFIVIAVRSYDSGTDIGEALSDALAQTTNLPSPDRYSTFALSRFSK